MWRYKILSTTLIVSKVTLNKILNLINIIEPNLYLKSFLVALKSIGPSDCQVVLDINMTPNLPGASNAQTKIYVAILDRSKASGEPCIDDGECKTAKCLSSGVCQSPIYFTTAKRYASKCNF